MYSSRDECYRDIYLSLTMGIVSVEDSKDLLAYYRDIEYYECCQGILDALKDYRKIQKEYNDNNR